MKNITNVDSSTSAGTAADSTTNVDGMNVSQNGTKPNVGSSMGQNEQLKNIFQQLGEAHTLLAKTTLSKEEYQPISTLLNTAKTELFNIYWETKNHKL